ncbi:MAG: hypothetical protein KKH08_01660 [Candidatus Omnitrophica bacterium]|nr:hypothetical protein [Candidatus Omnitrophota bacterium]
MIEIEFSLAVTIYLIVSVFSVIGLWIASERKNVQGLFSLEDAFFWQCSICTYVYVDSRHNAISKCPRCESFNKKE